MTYDAILPYLDAFIGYVLGSYVMYRIMKPKLSKALFQYQSMREAFQDKHVTNQKLFEGQQRLWDAYKELLSFKLRP
jgi:hypothetical protein